MIYIVFDLESIVVRNAGTVGRLVEIGAVELTEDMKKPTISDTFHTYIRTSSLEMIDRGTLMFIGADITDFEDAPLLNQAIASFREWIGGEEYYLCTWSIGDMWILAENWLIEKFDASWIKNYNNIQPPICRTITKGQTQMSLERAIEMRIGKQENEKYHSAMYDAINTALLFVDSFEDIKNTLSLNKQPFPAYIEMVKSAQQRKISRNARDSMKSSRFNSIGARLTDVKKREVIKKYFKE